MSDSDEDMPLAGLKRKNGKVNVEDDDEAEEPTNGKRRRSTSKPVNYADADEEEEEEEEEQEEEEESEEEEGDDDDDDEEEEDDDDSEEEDDDIPLAALKSKSPSPKKKKAPAKKKKAAPKKKKKVTASKSKSSSTTSSSSSSNYYSSSAALYQSGCQKGQLIQKLLCRWWYAITWPDPAVIPKEPPTNYDSLDGIPGVYVCTSGEDVGQIKDFRDKDTCPNFKNFASKPAEELQSLLIKALEAQKRILVTAEGQGTPTEKDIDTELKWAKKLNPTKADKEAVKVLKAAGMELP